MTTKFHKYKKPVNFNENLPEFNLFKNIPDEKYETPKLEIIKNARISTSSVIYNYFKIYAPSCIAEENYQKYQTGFRFFFKYIFPKFNFSKKKFLVITDEWTGNYYHWHIYALTRLMFLKEQNLIKDSLLFLPTKYKTYKFAIPSLEAFGITQDQIVFLRRKSNIKVREALWALKEQHNEEYISKVQKFLRKNLAKGTIDFGEKIYISREKMKLRFVENEEETVKFLEKYGFKKVVMEDYGYIDQISIASKAKYIVSPHGAGLTNVLFMKEGSSFLELTTKLPGTVTDYYRLASMINLNYFYQECEMGKNSRVMDWMNGSMIVDFVKLEENIKMMLSR